MIVIQAENRGAIVRRTVLTRKLEQANRLLAEAREMAGSNSAYDDLRAVECLRRLEATVDDAVTDAVASALRHIDSPTWDEIGAALGNQKDRTTPMHKNNARAWCVTRGLV